MENRSVTAEQHRLLDECQTFIDVVNNLSDDHFKRQPDGKWSVADVVQHLYLSARPVARLMSGAHDVLLQWGKPDAPLRTYDELKTAYQNILATGAKAPATMTPRPEDMQVEKHVVVGRFTSVYQALIDALDNWSDQELVDYCMPHPVLGKLSVREMLYFIRIHTQHHLKLLNSQ